MTMTLRMLNANEIDAVSGGLGSPFDDSWQGKDFDAPRTWDNLQLSGGSSAPADTPNASNSAVCRGAQFAQFVGTGAQVIGGIVVVAGAATGPGEAAALPAGGLIAAGGTIVSGVGYLVGTVAGCK
jgi:hypothetical protein